MQRILCSTNNQIMLLSATLIVAETMMILTITRPRSKQRVFSTEQKQTTSPSMTAREENLRRMSRFSGLYDEKKTHLRAMNQETRMSAIFQVLSLPPTGISLLASGRFAFIYVCYYPYWVEESVVDVLIVF